MSKLTNISVHENDDGIRIDRWFKRHYPDVPFVALQKAMRKGEVRIDGKRVKPDSRVVAGQMVRVPPFKIADAESRPPKKERVFDRKYIEMIERSVIYKDKDVIALNKPHGLATQGGTDIKISVDDLLVALKEDYDDKPKLVHRLDKDTSGVLLVARTARAATELGHAFKGKDVEKIYWAVVVGCPLEKEGKIEMPLIKKNLGKGNEKVVVDEVEGQKAITHYKVLDYAADKVALVELIPITGRTHQLRVHMSELGFPILGDGKYGGKVSFMNGLSDKMHLHAKTLKIKNFNGRKLSIEAECPKHFTETLKMLGFK